MAIVYHIDIENVTGNTIAVIKNPTSFRFTIRNADKGDYQLVLSGFDDVTNLFTADIIVRFWRKDTSAFDLLGNPTDFVNVFNGIHKTKSISLTESGNKTFTSYGPDSNELLDKAFILYPPNSAQSNKTTIATTAMIEYVRENIGGIATVGNGRRIGGINPITIGGTAGIGPVWSDEAANKHLLTVIQNIRDFALQNNTQIDFAVNYLGGYQWVFVCGNLYTDRTNVGLNPTTGRNGSGNIPVVFSPLYNNVKNFYESLSRYNEINTVTAIGSGVGGLQQTKTVRNNIASLVSPIAQRESVVNSNDSSLAQLTVVSQSALYEYVSKPNISFEPLLNDILLWRDFFPGDFVTALTEQRVSHHIQLSETTVDVSQSEGGSTIETLNLTFSTAIGV